MLVLTRKINEKLIIGENIEIIVLQVKGNNVKLGINAPKELTIYRGEIYEQVKRQNKMASYVSLDRVKALEKLLPPIKEI